MMIEIFKIELYDLLKDNSVTDRQIYKKMMDYVRIQIIADNQSNFIIK